MIQHKEFLSGTLNTIILALLKEQGKMYGYEICQQAKEKTQSVILLTEGAIYPALHKLEKKGFIISSKAVVNGRTRKYYAIQPEHSQDIEDKINALYSFNLMIQSLIKPTT